MESIELPIKNKQIILALGAESAGIFAAYRNGDIFVSENFGDLMDEKNFLKYKKAVLEYLRKEKIKPDAILTDLHPLLKTTTLGEELARKHKAENVKVQHHIAHIFSSVGDKTIDNTRYLIPDTFYGIAMDGTGYGLDENIWGGEIFKISNDPLRHSFSEASKFQMTNQIQNPKSKTKNKKNNLYIKRIGSLEEQIMIGGDLAVKEPARMLIAILAKIPNPKLQIPIKFQIPNLNVQKEFIFSFVKKFYTRNEFEALYNQLEQDFNCQITTSTGRILDAVSVLLGFAKNERKFKHEAVKLLEQNSGTPYNDIESRIKNYESRKILDITYLFECLIKNINRDKKRLAATAQLYIAKGFYEIVCLQPTTYKLQAIFAAGGMANNKIISSYLEKRGVYLSKKIPRGDEGIAFGQIIYYLTNSGH